MTDQGSHHASRPLATLLRSLRHRNFRLFFTGQLVSLIGTWMQSVAQSWLVYRMTGSALLLGTIAFLGQFPVLVLAPVMACTCDGTSWTNTPGDDGERRVAMIAAP